MSGEERRAFVSVYQNKFTLDKTLIIIIMIIIIISLFSLDSSIFGKKQSFTGSSATVMFVCVSTHKLKKSKQHKVKHNFTAHTNLNHQFQLTDRLLVIKHELSHSTSSAGFHPCPSMSVAITKQLHPVLGGRKAKHLLELH